MASIGQINTWIAFAAAAGVGLLAALVNSISLIVNKESKVTEFRQAWIDDQRGDLAAAVAAAGACAPPADCERKAERLAEFDAAQTRIELRENSNTPEWTDVRSLLRQVRTLMIAPSPDCALIRSKCEQLWPAARDPLKDNWTIVKEGERWTSTLKAALRFMLTILAIYVALALIVVA